MTIKTDRKTKKRGALLAGLQSSLPNDVLYTEFLPKRVTAYASMYSIKVSTQIVLILEGIRAKQQTVKRITKVTII